MMLSMTAIGQETSETASAAGRQKYRRAHGQDRASNGLAAYSASAKIGGF